MKPIFFFVIVATGLVSARPLASSEPSVGPDIVNTYEDGTKEENTYDSCVTIDNKNDKVLQSSVFSTLVKCNLYQDTDCSKLIESVGRTLPLPPVIELPNITNIGGKFAQAYKCSPLLATDTE